MNPEDLRELAKLAAKSYVFMYGSDMGHLDQFRAKVSEEALSDLNWGEVARTWQSFGEMLREEVDILCPLDEPESV